MLKKVVIFLLRGYKLIFSPFLRHRCRFVPSCSTYATEAIEEHGVWCGAVLTLVRLAKCHPLYRGKTYDPVPEKYCRTKKSESYLC